MLELLLPLPVLAHQIRIDQNMAGTLHLEPNDQPQAREITPTWIALRQPGGSVVTAADCDCQLQLLDVQTGKQIELEIVPLAIAPDAVAAEITFPSVGQYELLLQGQPSATAQTQFSPFQIRFPVTVATIATANSVPEPAAQPGASTAEIPADVTPELIEAGESSSWLRVLIPVSIGVGLLSALAAGVWLILKRDRDLTGKP